MTEQVVIFDSKYRNYIGRELDLGPMFIISNAASGYPGEIYVNKLYHARGSDMFGAEYITLDSPLLMPIPNETTGNDLFTMSIVEIMASGAASHIGNGALFRLMVAANNSRYMAVPRHTSASNSIARFVFPQMTYIPQFTFRFHSLSMPLTFKPDFIEFNVFYENPARFTVLRSASATSSATLSAHYITTGQFVSFINFTSATTGYISADAAADYVYKEKLYAATATSGTEITLPLDFSSVSGGPTTTTLFVESRRFYIPLTFGV
jgi:hypothetical protein